MSVQFTDWTFPRVGLTIVVAVIATSVLGVMTTWLPTAPILVLCGLATGAFFLQGTDVTPIERLILVPAIGLSAFAVASLLIPLTDALDLVRSPVHVPAVVATAATLPTVCSISYWAARPDSTVPTVSVNRRLLVPAIPVVLGASGALLQWQFGVVVQNYVVMGILVCLAPLLLYWAETEFDAAISLYGLALGTILSHTLVTGYSVGVDIQMSLHTVDQVTAVGTWDVNNVFFREGADSVPLSELAGYISADLTHTGLPVIVGVPVLFEIVGNSPPDAVFDLLYVGLFGLTPVAIYRLGRESLSVRDAFVAGLLPIVYFRFFHTSPGKQHIAQFLMGALLVLWHTRVKSHRRRVASILLSVGIVFSHYGVTFLFVGFLFGAYVLAKWFSTESFQSDISPLFLGYLYSFVTLWYVVITGAKKPVGAVSAIISSVQGVLSSGSAQHRTGANVAAQKTLLVDQINLGLHMLLLVTMGLGVLALAYHALRTRRPVFSKEIDGLSVGFLGLVSASTVVSGALGIDRALDIGLVVLAPVAVYGVSQSFALFDYVSPLPKLRPHTHRIGLAFVVLMFVFSSGLGYEVAGEPATSAINLHEEPNSVMFTDAEYQAANWTLQQRNGSTVYAGTFVSTVFHRLSGPSLPYLFNYKNYTLQPDVAWNESGYIYVRKAALTENTSRPTQRHLLERDQYAYFRQRADVAYENRDAVVLRIDPEPNATSVERTDSGATTTS